jgi:hypothetical protein
MFMDNPFLQYWLLVAITSVGPLLAVAVAATILRTRRSIAAVLAALGAVLFLFAHLLSRWWNVPGAGTFVDGRSYELAVLVGRVHITCTTVGQCLLFGGLLAHLRPSWRPSRSERG